MGPPADPPRPPVRLVSARSFARPPGGSRRFEEVFVLPKSATEPQLGLFDPSAEAIAVDSHAHTPAAVAEPEPEPLEAAPLEAAAMDDETDVAPPGPDEPGPKAPPARVPRATAQSMAQKQREISVS